MSERQDEASLGARYARAEFVLARAFRQADVVVNDVAFHVFGGAGAAFAIFAAHVDWYAGLLQNLQRGLVGRNMQRAFRPDQPDVEWLFDGPASWCASVRRGRNKIFPSAGNG